MDAVDSLVLRSLTGWYFDKSGALRECLVVNANMGVGQVAVIDVETGQPVDVAVEDVLTEKPE